MATVGYKRRRRRSQRMSLRRTMLVWIGGAIVGWAVMVTTVYNLLRFPEDGLTTAQIDMAVDPAVIASEAEKLNQIEPAAGGNVNDGDAASVDASAPTSDEDADQKDDAEKAENSDTAADDSDKATPPDSEQ